MQHQHIKKSEQTHESDSDRNSAKQGYAKRLDVQRTGLKLRTETGGKKAVAEEAE